MGSTQPLTGNDMTENRVEQIPVVALSIFSHIEFIRETKMKSKENGLKKIHFYVTIFKIWELLK